MTNLVLLLNGGLMAVMTLVEFLHFRQVRRFTFLSASHGLIAIGYCVPAFLLAWLPGTRLATGPWGPADTTPWGTRLYILDLADSLRLPDSAYLTTAIVLWGAYAMLAAVYFAARRLPVRSLSHHEPPARHLVLAGAVLGVLTVAAMAIYVSQFTGPGDFFKAGWQIRAGKRLVHWGFLQVLAELGLPAFLMLAVAALRVTGGARLALMAATLLVWATELLRLIHTSGRLELGTFLLIPLVAWAFVTPARRLATVVLVVTLAAGLFLASAPYDLFSTPATVLPRMAATVLTNLDKMILYVLKDFAFPYIAAAHTLTVVPDPIPFRYFVDIPLGAAYMLPNFTGVETLPPMILSLHVKLLPWIPVDLFSFGYYSLGTVGVLITFAAFGAVLAVFDGWLTFSTGWLGQAFRAAWLFYLPFRLLYADPYASAQSGFGLITGTVVLLAVALLSRRRGGT